jgi:hypothetical protein
MKKTILAILILMGLKTFAQLRTCGTPVPPQQFETWVQSLNTNASPGKYGTGTTNSIFNIPVIVHIIHNNESVNSISATSGNNLNAAQIVDQINILNKDYNGLNADTSLIPSVFKPVLGKFKINFCLAVVNPTGGVLAEPGIDRINRISKGWSSMPYSQTYIDGTVKPNSIWNTSKYLNIWVCPLSGGLLGYATFPAVGTSGLSGLSGSGSTTTDGVVILNTSFGSIGTAQSGQYNKGRTATHEIGHWMGLRHVWGDANCGTDYCADTPPAQNANYSCPGFPFKQGTCSGNTTGEMTMNYMDYTDDACMYMFTSDQKNRAQLILTNSSMRTAVITSTVCNLPTVGNDVGISFVAKPTYSQVISCLNYINPIINVTNFGSTPLTSALLSFNVDGVNTQTMNWTGNAASNTSFTVALTQISNLGFGTHVFSVNVSSPNGGSDNNLSNNNNIQNFSIVNNLNVTAPSQTICQGGSIYIVASGATNYTWSTGANTQGVTLGPNLTTVYTVTGTTGICTAQRTITLTVQTTPTLSIDKTEVCLGQTATVTASGADNYIWSGGAGSSSSITVNLTAPAIYTLTGSTSAGCFTSQVFNINVNPLPTVTVSASYVSCATCSDAIITATGSGGTGTYSYLWTPGSSTGQILTNAGVGCYTVTISDGFSCSKVDSACVSFDTGILHYLSDNVGIRIQPNPTEGEFTITTKINGLKTIEIVDAIGRTINVSKTADSSLTLNLSNYNGGIYYVKVTSEKSFSVIKLVKQ